MGPACDIYSLGVIMYELLTGKLPFDGPPAAVLGQIMIADPASPSSIHPELHPQLEAICMKAMAKKPENRFSSMRELASAIDEYLGACAQSRKSSPRQYAMLAGAAIILAIFSITIVLQTCYGNVRIEVDDRATGVELQLDGDRITLHGPGETFRLKVGKHNLRVTGNNFETVANSFTVRWGSNEPVRVEFRPKESTSTPEGNNESLAKAESHEETNRSTPKISGKPANPASIQFEAKQSSEELQLLECPADAATAARAQEAASTSMGVSITPAIELGAGVDLSMVLIPPGTFEYGSPETEFGRSQMDLPQRRERIPRAFLLGKYEITREQWQVVFGDAAPPSGSGDLEGPASGVSFLAASDFVTLLNKRTGVRFRLPTEVEWEYACRAGTEGPHYCGLSSFLTEYECFGQPTGTVGVIFEGKPQRVGSKKPNPFGLHDMLGNVNEWCSGIPEGPWGRPDARALRGGCVLDKSTCTRCTARYVASVETTRLTGVCHSTPRGARRQTYIETPKPKPHKNRNNSRRIAEVRTVTLRAFQLS